MGFLLLSSLINKHSSSASSGGSSQEKSYENSNSENYNENQSSTNNSQTTTNETKKLSEITNLAELNNEVEKIKVFLDGEKFDIEKIKNIVSIEKEYQIYEMTRNILLNNPADVMRYLEQKKEYMGILYSLYNELETMYKISSLKLSSY